MATYEIRCRNYFAISMNVPSLSVAFTEFEGKDQNLSFWDHKSILKSTFFVMLTVI